MINWLPTELRHAEFNFLITNLKKFKEWIETKKTITEIIQSKQNEQNLKKYFDIIWKALAFRIISLDLMGLKIKSWAVYKR